MDPKMADRVCLFWVSVFIALISETSCNLQKDENVSKSYRPTIGSPWPMPKMMTASDIPFPVDDNFRFILSSNQRCDILEAAFVRYQTLIFGAKGSSLRFRQVRPLKPWRGGAIIIDSLQVHVMSVCTPGAYPSLDSDESYTLDVDADGAVLRANEAWGALRGLETFSQMVYRMDLGSYAINKTTIQDAPRFKHRGILLDTSRHFLSVSVIKTNLDVMAQHKFNVFHWHIVDDPSFPYESYTFPDMSRMGAYEPVNHHVYTQENIKEIIEYARMRGIRVVPEFDSPGHTQSWGKAMTDLLTKCYTSGSWNGNYGPVNPVPKTTYDFLTKFFGELAMVFPDHYVHLGGDEVSFSCWESNPNITKFMNSSGFGKDYAKLEEYYMQKLLTIVQGLNKGYIIWQEVVDNKAKVAADTVVEVWKGGYQDEMAKVTSLGYKVLLAAPWYLDYIAYGAQWTKYYQPDPHDFNGTAAQKDLVVGGEACLWGEYVDDTNLISRLWPRASAVAERLWSPKEVTNVDQAAARLEEHRCRLVRRGYPAEPPNGPGFCRDEYS